MILTPCPLCMISREPQGSDSIPCRTAAARSVRPMWVQNKIELMSIDCVAMIMAAQNQDAG